MKQNKSLPVDKFKKKMDRASKSIFLGLDSYIKLAYVKNNKNFPKIKGCS